MTDRPRSREHDRLDGWRTPSHWDRRVSWLKQPTDLTQTVRKLVRAVKRELTPVETLSEAWSQHVANWLPGASTVIGFQQNTVHVHAPSDAARMLVTTEKAKIVTILAEQCAGLTIRNVTATARRR
jgi:hypothetical protein